MLTENSSATVVLIVEDDSSHIALLSRSFASCPEAFRLHVAGTLRVARQSMDLRRPNLVLANHCLPDGRGSDLVVQTKPTCPVLLMTADDSEQIAVETLHSGAMDYVVKSPQAFAEMPRTVRQALREWTLLQDPIRAREVLERQEQRGRVMMDNSPDPIALFDREGHCLYVNPAFEELIGLPSPRLLGKTLDMIPAEVAAAMAKPVQQVIGLVLSEGVSTEVELSLRNRNGSNRCYGVRLVPKFDGNRLQSILSAFRDIGELQEAQNERKEQLDFLSQLLESLPLPVFYKDIDGVYRGCNEAFASFIGQSKDENLGRTVFDLAPKAQADVYHETDDALFRQGGQQLYETSVIDNDGVRHEVIFHKATYADSNGCIAGIVGAILDVTDSKHHQVTLAASERKFRTLVENTPDTIACYDRECRRIYANNTFAELADVPVEELLGKTPTDCTNSPGAVEYENRIRQAFQSGTIDEFEFTWPDRNGKEITSLIRLVPERNEEGRIDSVLCAGRDITERKRTEDQLHRWEQEFRAMIENSPDPVIRYDHEGRRIYVNPALEKLMGQPAHLLIGKTPAETPVAGMSRSAGRCNGPSIALLTRESPLRLKCAGATTMVWSIATWSVTCRRSIKKVRCPRFWPLGETSAR